jgi:predicted RNase H-like HicB family nuclease
LAIVLVACTRSSTVYLSSMPMDEFYLKVRIEPLDEGGFLATSPDLPGLVAQGRTRAETMEIAQDVARRLIESHLEHGDPLPPAVRKALKNSGRVSTVAIPVGLSLQPA